MDTTQDLPTVLTLTDDELTVLRVALEDVELPADWMEASARAILRRLPVY